MEIKGKVFCLFEQSGTFKKEFLKLGIPAEDYDIRDDFGCTDYKIDLLEEITKAYNRRKSLFSEIEREDLILAFFPCTYFCENNVLQFNGKSLNYNLCSDLKKTVKIIERSRKRQKMYESLLMLFAVCLRRNLRLIVENPYSTQHYLHNNFPFSPAIVDMDRRTRGDLLRKPTQFFFLNCTPGTSKSFDPSRFSKIVANCNRTERSLMTPQYAQNFICDHILNNPRHYHQTQLDL